MVQNRYNECNNKDNRDNKYRKVEEDAVACGGR